MSSISDRIQPRTVKTTFPCVLVPITRTHSKRWSASQRGCVTFTVVVASLLNACASDALPPPLTSTKVQSTIGGAELQTNEAKALAGDKDAALQLALMYQGGLNGVERDEQKMVHWLRHASDLGNGRASYQLYLYYLERRLDREAVHYENRAIDQGFIPPPRLNPRRG